MDIKEKIILKASQLFREKGIKGTSMDELASSLGISKRTIYVNFEDKEHILIQILNYQREVRNKKIAEYVEKSENVIEVFLRLLELFNEMPDINPIFYEEIYKNYPNIFNSITDVLEHDQKNLIAFFNMGIEQGMIRKDLNVEISAFILGQNSFKYMIYTFLDKPVFPLKQIKYAMMTNFIRGISTEKGIQIVDAYLAQHGKDNKDSN